MIAILGEVNALKLLVLNSNFPYEQFVLMIGRYNKATNFFTDSADEEDDGVEEQVMIHKKNEEKIQESLMIMEDQRRKWE